MNDEGNFYVKNLTGTFRFVPFDRNNIQLFRRYLNRRRAMDAIFALGFIRHECTPVRVSDAYKMSDLAVVISS